MQEKILKTASKCSAMSSLTSSRRLWRERWWIMAVAVRKSAVDNARLELESNRHVRAIIAQNVGIGMAESYDLNQYNALVASRRPGLKWRNRSIATL
jgi:LPS O-antigen subunit length determinant protein (WzzB/FepE family)